MQRKKKIDIDKATLLGERISMIRKAQGITIKALSITCDLDANLLSSIELGRGNPRFSTLLVIAEALSVTVSELTKGL